jgi:hypothetical protein
VRLCRGHSETERRREVKAKFMVGDSVGKKVHEPPESGRPSAIRRGEVQEVRVETGVIWYVVRRDDGKVFRAREDELVGL